MSPIPDTIDDARVICASPIDVHHLHTGACVHRVRGVVVGPMAGLAICQYGEEDAPGFYLFGCDQEWNCITDTYHGSMDEALRQAGFEYAGIRETMIYKAPIQSRAPITEDFAT